MADWNKPALTDAYADFLTYLGARLVDAAKGFDPAKVTVTNTPTDTIRWNSASNKWEKYNGSAWGDLSSGYAIAITGNAGSATKLATGRTLSVSIVTTAPTNPTFDGSADKTLQAQLTGTLVTTALGYTPPKGDGTGASGTWNITAAAVTGGVYTSGDQTIAGVKSFSSQLESTNGTYALQMKGAIGGSYSDWNGTRGTTIQIDAPQNGYAYSLFRVTKWGERHLAAMDVYAGGSSSSTPRVDLHVGSTTNAFVFSQGGAFYATGDISNGGSITATGDVTAYSDERYKSNWRAFGAEFIDQLAGVKCGVYDRMDTGRTQVGVGAQSLQAVIPWAVLQSENGDLSVAYGNAALAASVELSKAVVSMRAELAALREEVSTLKG